MFPIEVRERSQTRILHFLPIAQPVKAIRTIPGGGNTAGSFNNCQDKPFRFLDDRGYLVNERILEEPFVLSELRASDKKMKILDFGCTGSWLSISLTSLGHDVHGIDLREYPIKHRKTTFHQKDVLQLEERDFDAVVALSTFEHVGLGAYGESIDLEAPGKVLDKFHDLIVHDGRLILTVPAGRPFTDRFTRSFAPDEIELLVTARGFILEKSLYFIRHDFTHWEPANRREMLNVSNEPVNYLKRHGGSNGVGCLVFRRSAKLKLFSHVDNNLAVEMTTGGQ